VLHSRDHRYPPQSTKLQPSSPLLSVGRPKSPRPLFTRDSIETRHRRRGMVGFEMKSKAGRGTEHRGDDIWEAGVGYHGDGGWDGRRLDATEAIPDGAPVMSALASIGLGHRRTFWNTVAEVTEGCGSQGEGSRSCLGGRGPLVLSGPVLEYSGSYYSPFSSTTQRETVPPCSRQLLAKPGSGLNNRLIPS